MALSYFAAAQAFSVDGLSLADPYLAVFVDEPNLDGSDALTLEVAGAGYARQQFSWGTPDAGYVEAVAGVEFIDCPAVTFAYVGLFDAPTGGNLLAVFALPSAVTWAAGQTWGLTADDISYLMQ